MAAQRDLLILVLVCTVAPAAFAQLNTAKGQFLYVATGDQDKAQNDTLVVINFNRTSPLYGKVVTRVSLNSRGNEPKLVVSNLVNKELALGGFFTFVTGQTPNQKDTFFLSLTNPAAPVLVGTASAPTTGLPAAIVPKKDGSWLCARMGSKIGDAPGKFAEFTAARVFKNEVGVGPAINPHGLAIREDLNMSITTDFLNPRSALIYLGASKLPLTGLTLRSTIRIWRLPAKTLASTVAVPDVGAGLIDVKFIPGDLLNRAFVTGGFSGKIYLVTPNKVTFAATVATAIDLKPLFGNVNPGPAYITLVNKYKIGFVSLTFAGRVAMFSYANPAALKLITSTAPGLMKNPGYIEAFKGDDRFTVTDYFLDMLRPGLTPTIAAVKNTTPFGNIRLNGTGTVRVFTFTATTLAADPKWPVSNFNTLFPLSGPQTPHGVAYYPAN